VSKSRQISAEGDDDGMWAWSGLELGLETSRGWVQVLAMISSQGKSSMWPTLLHALNGVRHLGPALIDNNIRLGFICPWGWNWWFIVVWSGLGPGYGIHRIHMFLPIAYVTLWEWVAIRVDKLWRKPLKRRNNSSDLTVEKGTTWGHTSQILDFNHLQSRVRVLL